MYVHEDSFEVHSGDSPTNRRPYIFELRRSLVVQVRDVFDEPR